MCSPRAKERARKAKAKVMEARAQEDPNGARGPGERAKVRYQHLMRQLSGSGAKALKILNGRQA